MLKDTLAQAVGDLQVFVVLMLTILAGFVIMALNIFGTQAEPYKNFLNAFGTLFLILLGALHPNDPQPRPCEHLSPPPPPHTTQPPT